MARFPLPTWAPREPAEIPGLILCPPKPPPAACVLREGRGSKSKGQTYGTGTSEGWLGEGRSSYTQWDPPMVRGPAGMGETLGGVAEERNVASDFPVHLCTGEPVGLPGLILCPQSLPPTIQSPSPTPTSPPRALPLHSENHSETPSNCAGPNPHPHTLTQGLTSKLQNSTFQRPPFRYAASPLPHTS